MDAERPLSLLDAERPLSLLVSNILIERDHLINRLNAIYNRIESEDKLIAKVLLQIEWLADKRESISRLKCIITQLQTLLECDMSTSRSCSIDSQSSFSNLVSTPEHDQALELEELNMELYTTTICMMREGFVRETFSPEKRSHLSEHPDEPDQALEIEALNMELYTTTICMISEGFVRETFSPEQGSYLSEHPDEPDPCLYGVSDKYGELVSPLSSVLEPHSREEAHNPMKPIFAGTVTNPVVQNQTGYGTDLKATVTRASRPSLPYRLLGFISGIRYMNPVKYKSMVRNNKHSQYRVCPHCERCPF
jgi:hypothetical protein